jgi:hypothetical protein
MGGTERDGFPEPHAFGGVCHLSDWSASAGPIDRDVEPRDASINYGRLGFIPDPLYDIQVSEKNAELGNVAVRS